MPEGKVPKFCRSDPKCRATGHQLALVRVSFVIRPAFALVLIICRLPVHLEKLEVINTVPCSSVKAREQGCPTGLLEVSMPLPLGSRKMIYLNKPYIYYPSLFRKRGK
jgi:hypothetical protein